MDFELLDGYFLGEEGIYFVKGGGVGEVSEIIKDGVEMLSHFVDTLYPAEPLLQYEYYKSGKTEELSFRSPRLEYQPIEPFET